MHRRKAALWGALLAVVLVAGNAALFVQRRNQEFAAARDVAVQFMQALSDADLNRAGGLSWGDYMASNLSSAGIAGFRGAEIVSVGRVQKTTTANRPAVYRGLHRLVVVPILLRTTNADDAGQPAGDYTIFTLMVQPRRDAEWRVAELGTAP